MAIRGRAVFCLCSVSPASDGSTGPAAPPRCLPRPIQLRSAPFWSQRVDRRPFQVRNEAGSAVAATRWPSLVVMSCTSQARRDGTEEGVVARMGRARHARGLVLSDVVEGGGYRPYGHKDVAVGAASAGTVEVCAIGGGMGRWLLHSDPSSWDAGSEGAKKKKHRCFVSAATKLETYTFTASW